MNNPVYTTGNSKKHPAFILAVDAAFFENVQVLAETGMVSAFRNPINPYPHELFLEMVQSDLVIREREYLDNGETTHPSRRTDCGTKFKKGNPRYKQVLPYLVARQRQEDGSYIYFPYRRTKGVGESRLAGNGSLGYGGHVDLADVVMTTSSMHIDSLDADSPVDVALPPTSVIDLRATIIGSLLREANEEFTVLNAENVKVAVEESWFTFGDLYILDNSNEVGELHLGLIMHLDIPTGFTLIATEDELAKLPAMSAEQMLTDPTFKPENWTSIYLNFVAQQAGNILGIDHGGNQVGQVDSTFLATEVGALEAGNNDRIKSTIDAASLRELSAQVNDPEQTKVLDNMATTIEACDQIAAARKNISVQVPAGEDPILHIQKALDGVSSEELAAMIRASAGAAPTLQEAAQSSVVETGTDRFVAKTSNALKGVASDAVGEMLEVTHEEEEHFRGLAAQAPVSQAAAMRAGVDASHLSAVVSSGLPLPLTESTDRVVVESASCQNTYEVVGGGFAADEEKNDVSVHAS